MKRKTGALGVACAAISATAAIAGCATARSGPVSSPPPPLTPKPPPPLTPKQRAAADAASILAAFVPPPGARRLPGAPGSAARLTSPVMPGTNDTVDDVSWWRVSEQPRPMLSWEAAHLPRRFSSARPEEVCGPGTSQAWSQKFSLPDVGSVLTDRELEVSAATTGGGQIVIRVDAVSAWLPPRKYVPSTAGVVTIAPVQSSDASGKRPATVTVTDPVKTRQIVSIVNGLSVFPPGVYSCPAFTGQGIRLTFRASAGGPAVAVAVASTGGCETVSLTVGGESQPSLGGAGSLVTRTLAIAGLRWPGY